MVVTLGQQYHVGEKPTDVLYTYIDRQAGTPSKTKTKYTMSLDYSYTSISDEGYLQDILYKYIIIDRCERPQNYNMPQRLIV